MEMLLACRKGITMVSIGMSAGESGLGGRKKPHERVQMSKSLAVGKLWAHLDRVVASDWKIG